MTAFTAYSLFSDDDRSDVITAHLSGRSIPEIAGVMGRSPKHVKRLLEEFTRRASPAAEPDDDLPAHCPPVDHVAENTAFCIAMMHAVEAGTEHPPLLGVFRDDTLMARRAYYAPPQSSGCSSAAQLCAEIGDSTTGSHW